LLPLTTVATETPSGSIILLLLEALPAVAVPLTFQRSTHLP
jgi:hypothetical protein